MARTVIVFRDNMIERDRLTSDQNRSVREKEQRSEAVAGSIDAFRSSIQQALASITDSCASICYRSDGKGNFITTKLFYVQLGKDGFTPVD